MQPNSKKKPNFQLLTSRGFASWLASQNTSLAFTTYQTGKLFMVGLKQNGALSIFSRNFDRAMGLWGDEQTLYLATKYQFWRFENYLNEGPMHGDFEPITFCPDFMRGLAFIDHYAIIGLSKPRNNKTFSDLPLNAELQAKNADARCGLCVIDLHNGSIIQWLNIEGTMGEMYDVVTLPGVTCSTAVGFKTDEISRTIKLGQRHWIGQNR